jgi:hypothetical protein
MLPANTQGGCVVIGYSRKSALSAGLFLGFALGYAGGIPQFERVSSLITGRMDA